MADNDLSNHKNSVYLSDFDEKRTFFGFTVVEDALDGDVGLNVCLGQ